jgi:hypothetical protein
VPVPVAESVTHVCVTDDVQAHPGCVVTLIVPVPPVGRTVTSRGLTVNVHELLGWLTV